jgi:putative DNA primase/helicase
MTALSLSPSILARALGGEAYGHRVAAPGPGHSRKDRSLSILVDQSAPGGFLVTSHAGDDPLACKDYVRTRLDLAVPLTGLSRPHGPPPTSGCPRANTRDVDAEKGQDPKRTARALTIWSESHPPKGTPVQAYLERRSLTWSDEVTEALRYHPACPFADQRVPAVIALVRDIVTNEPKAIHRTALDLDGQKIEVAGKDRLALGPVAGGAVKLTPDEEVTLALGIGEGIETALSLRELPEFGSSPVWSLLSTAGVAAFPVLSGIEALWIAVDHDPAGERAARTCADRWRAEGREVYLVRPRAQRADLNDMVKGRSRHAG